MARPPLRDSRPDARLTDDARIQRQIECNIAYYAARPDEINTRLRQLNEEWDIERTLEANAAGLSVASVLLGFISSRRWLFMPAVVGGFLLQHAVQGSCAPLKLFRRMGVRTQSEIERERYALKALRGDFSSVTPLKNGEPRNVLAISRRVMDALK
jgi:hypothetical protein